MLRQQRTRDCSSQLDGGACEWVRFARGMDKGRSPQSVTRESLYQTAVRMTVPTVRSPAKAFASSNPAGQDSSAHPGSSPCNSPPHSGRCARTPRVGRQEGGALPRHTPVGNRSADNLCGREKSASPYRRSSPTKRSTEKINVHNVAEKPKRPSSPARSGSASPAVRCSHAERLGSPDKCVRRASSNSPDRNEGPEKGAGPTPSVSGAYTPRPTGPETSTCPIPSPSSSPSPSMRSSLSSNARSSRTRMTPGSESTPRPNTGYTRMPMGQEANLRTSSIGSPAPKSREQLYRQGGIRHKSSCGSLRPAASMSSNLAEKAFGVESSADSTALPSSSPGTSTPTFTHHYF